MSGNIAPYLALVTSEHADKPNFIASLTALLQPVADMIEVLESIPTLYDLDVAVGAQEDVVGLWVGASRTLKEPISGVYFSWGTPGLGWGQGTWKGPFDPDSGLVSLPDDSYRVLIRATIAANNWDGTVPGAYAVWQTVFNIVGQPILDMDGLPWLDTDGLPIIDLPAPQILIQDNGDMSMIFALMQPNPDAVTLALFTQGYFKLKPAGVHLEAVVPSVSGAPLFGFGVQNGSIAGWGGGCWPKILSQD